MKILKTVFQSILVGFLAGGGIGFVLGMLLYVHAEFEAKSMDPGQAASYLCGAGMAPIGLALLGAVAGLMVGMIVGVTLAMIQRAEQISSTQLTFEK